MQKYLRVIEGTKEEVMEAEKRTKENWQRQRLQVVRLAKEHCYTTTQVAQIVGVGRGSVSRWVKNYRMGGIDKLLERSHGGGARSVMTPKSLDAMVEGLQQGSWKRAGEIQRWLQESQGIKIGIQGVYYWLKKLGGVLKVPRKTHAKQDEAQAQEFKNQL